MDEAERENIGAALGQIPSGLFILTSRYEDRSTGMLASWVQQASFSPPMVSVAVAKGREILPLISESRQFALCQLPKDDKILLRKFAKPANLSEDPFLGFEMQTGTVTNSPVLANILGYLECDLACHVDADGDHDLFIGKICGGKFLNSGEPFVHIRKNGFSY